MQTNILNIYLSSFDDDFVVIISLCLCSISSLDAMGTGTRDAGGTYPHIL